MFYPKINKCEAIRYLAIIANMKMSSVIENIQIGFTKTR